MTTLVGTNNQLYQLTKENLRDYDEYEEAPNTPEFKYTRDVSARVIITKEDGRLYHTVSKQYLDEHRDFKSVITDQYKDWILALKNNGDLYSGFLDVDNVTIEYFELIDTEVEWITSGLRENDRLSIKGKVVTIYTSLLDNKTITLDDNVIDVYPGIVVTDSKFLVIGYDIIVEFLRSGRLIGCGIVKYYSQQHWYRDDHLIVIEEVEDSNSDYDDNYTVTVRCGPIINDYIPEVYSEFLINMHYTQSPWVDVITVDNKLLMLSKNGHTIELLPNAGIINTKLPYYMFKI